MLQLEKRHQLILMLFAAVLIFIGGYKYASINAVGQPGEQGLVTGESGAGEEIVNDDSFEQSEIVVHVAGAVQNPGVYRLSPGARVIEAIELAGATEDSALDYLNLAAPLEDGRQIMVMSRKEIEEKQQSTVASLPGAAVTHAGGSAFISPGAASSALININIAGNGELETLPGIGPALAQRIIDHRLKNGPFISVEDIMGVSGIGEKRFEDLKDKICVN